jgi:hypothetical protein
LWCLLRLLYKAVEQYCLIPFDGEQYTGNPAAAKVAPNLEEPIADGSTGGHADRPAEFNRPDIVTNSLAVLDTQAPQPFADGLRTGRRLVKRGRQSFHRPSVPKMVHGWQD